MKYIINYSLFESSDSFISDEELEWGEHFPEVTDDYVIPENQLYRWLTPDIVYEYLRNPDMIARNMPGESGHNIDGQYQEGSGDTVDGIPFFDNPYSMYAMAEPFCRVILDRERIEADGYTIFDPKRDPGEIRVHKEIKNWMNYLLYFEVNRDEFVLEWDDELDDYSSEFPIPFDNRKELLNIIQSKIPADKLIIIDEEIYEDLEIN